MGWTYSSGENPFHSPKAGDVVRSRRSGITRTVISVGREEVDYEVDGKHKTSHLDSWASWCSRNRAEFLGGRIER